MIVEVVDAIYPADAPNFAIEVVLLVPSGTPTLATYAIGLTVVSEPLGFDLNFLEAVESIDNAAVFPGQIPKHDFPVPNDDTLYVADNLPVGSTPIVDGAGLFRVVVEFNPSAVPGSAFEVAIDRERTMLFTSDSQGQVVFVPIDEFRSGTITLVPEPGTGSLVFAAFGVLGWRRRPRHAAVLTGHR